ncbi:ATP synthase delta chain [Nymphaea thermarum]|nr:ATP synthase delta chain [Nymphaea thermarum]
MDLVGACGSGRIGNRTRERRGTPMESILAFGVPRCPACYWSLDRLPSTSHCAAGAKPDNVSVGTSDNECFVRAFRGLFASSPPLYIALTMSILNKSIPPHPSPAVVSSQTATQIRRKMSVTVSGHSSSESCRKRTQLGAKHSRHGGVLEFVDDDAVKLSDKEKPCNFVPDQIADVDPEKTFRTVPDDAVFGPFTLGFVRSVTGNESISMIKDRTASLDISGRDSAVNTLVVSVSSAVKLQHNQRDQIAKKMQSLTGATHIGLKNTIDTSLIAGFVISYEKEGSHVIDLSVKGQLDQLVAHIESNDQKNAAGLKVISS